MNSFTEISALQNAADDLNLSIKEKYQEDRRRTVKKYYAVLGDKKTSPVLDYEQMNHFLLGFRAAVNK